MFKRCETEFEIDRHLIPFLQECAFYAEISRHVHKIPTRDIPTAGVTYDPVSDELCLFFNPDFFESLSNWQIRGVLTHEFNHLVFGHLSARRRSPPKMWNIATDLAINSLIVKNAGKPRDVGDDADAMPLPKGCLIPGVFPVPPNGRALSKEEKDAMPIASLIASFPDMQASEWYFNKLQECVQQNGGSGSGKGSRGMKMPGQEGSPGDEPGEGGGEDWLDSFDDHGSWDDVPDEVREYIEGKVKTIIEKAVRAADQTSTGWGNIPQDMREDIRRSVSTQINWRSVLRQFVGSLVRGARTTSIKRINRRYPYIHPGIKRGYVAKLLIAIDQSGSVGDEMLTEFFAELSTLTKKVDVTILPFDCSADVKDTFEWKRGTKPALRRVKMGGTDFTAPTQVFNDPKNRGRWDGMMIMTDGQAPAPCSSRGKRGWILGKDCSLIFPSTELQIFITKEHPMTGAWR